MSTATQDPVKPAEKTAEQIAADAAKLKEIDQAEANKLARTLLFGEPGEKPAEEPAKPDDKGGSPATAAAAQPKRPKKAPKRPAPVAEPRPDPDDVIARTAEATGRAVAEAMRPKEPEKKDEKPDYSFMTEEERDLVPVLERMAAMKPDRYKDLVSKYTENLKAIAEYEAKWKEGNPDEEFDPESKEHNEFYAKHTIDWADLDEKKAIADLVSEPRLKEEREKTQAELADLRRKDRQRELDPEVFTESKRLGRQVFDMAGGEFKDLLAENGLTKESVLNGILEKDPMAAEIIFAEVNKIEAWGAENYRLFKGAKEFDKENPVHRFLAEFALAQEREILALPKDQQVNGEGKKFLPSAQWYALSEPQRSRFYTLSVTELNNLMAAEFGAKAVKKVEAERKRLDQFASKYGYAKQNGGAPAPAPRPGAPAREEEEEDDAPRQVTTKRVGISTPASRRSDIPPANVESDLVKALIG